jgi:hypothetical protein
MITDKKFDWERWEKYQFGSSRMPTDGEAYMFIRLFEECPWCVIRDILIDSGLTDEDFPTFWLDGPNKKMRASKF